MKYSERVAIWELRERQLCGMLQISVLTVVCVFQQGLRSPVVVRDRKHILLKVESRVSRGNEQQV